MTEKQNVFFTLSIVEHLCKKTKSLCNEAITIRLWKVLYVAIS